MGRGPGSDGNSKGHLPCVGSRKKGSTPGARFRDRAIVSPRGRPDLVLRQQDLNMGAGVTERPGRAGGSLSRHRGGD